VTEPTYSRILLKLSGEVLAGPQPYGIDLQTLKGLAQEIREVSDLGVSIALVLGGGNIFRGLAASASGMTALEMREIAEPYVYRRAIRHMEKGRVILLAGGTGNPYFTTDTAAALRALEIHAQVILKGTKVDGVYSEDPEKNPSATFYPTVSYMDVLKGNLKVMDLTAISMCMEAQLPIHVFNIRKRGNIRRVLEGESVGSVVKG